MNFFKLMGFAAKGVLNPMTQGVAAGNAKKIIEDIVGIPCDARMIEALQQASESAAEYKLSLTKHDYAFELLYIYFMKLDSKDTWQNIDNIEMLQSKIISEAKNAIEDGLILNSLLISNYNELSKASSENMTAMHSSSASSSEATMADESKVVSRDCPNVSMLERTVGQLIQFVVESRAVTHSIVTEKDMIGTLERLPQFKKLPSTYQMEVLDIVETEYRLTRNYDDLVRTTDNFADNEKFKELSAERMFRYISQLESFAGLSEHERDELECYVQLKFPK
ncbi:MAG: hypothetical protein P8H52_00165 [Porticoccaceae bacterium]|nr:hypothetical protein [Porticoccaceae bacterium]